jgi:alpha-1,2-rhamnosyltransferase
MPHLNTGIQRVVRNIVSRLSRFSEISEAIPVILKNCKVYKVIKISPANKIMSFLNIFYFRITIYKDRYWIYCRHICAYRLFAASHNLRKYLLIIFKIFGVFLNIAYQAVSRFCEKCELGKRISEISMRTGDVLILLDSSWYINPRFIKQVEELKNNGVMIVSVVYDIIPLQNPKYFHDMFVVIFKSWFNWISQIADGFMTISKTMRNQLQSHIRQNSFNTSEQRQWFDYFCLGSELDLVKRERIVRSTVKAIFCKNNSVYLTVGTIEPRKNHKYLLDAFELLWRENLDVTLYFVGKIGWKSEALVKRVKTHSEYNRRLFMFNDITDAELEYCYMKSRCLVLPSFIEGFGLPIVEAKQRGLPVMASDIPVFREVGEGYAAYFDLRESQTLAELICQYEKNGEFPTAQKGQDLSRLTWDNSTKELLTKIKSHVLSSRNGNSIKAREPDVALCK